MSIHKIKNGSYRAQVDFGTKLDGSRDRRSKITHTKKEAIKAERELYIERDGFGGHSERITFSDFVDKYYWPEKVKTLRANTLKGYERDIRLYLRPAFGNTDIGKISRLKIQSMISGCPSNKTANNARETLRAILSEAVQMDALPSNPASGRFKFPAKKVQDKDPYRYGEWVTSFAEQRAIIAQATGDTRMILVLGFGFGLRKGEILGLDWQDVDLEHREIHIKQTFTYTKGPSNLNPPKTEESWRTVPMTNYAYQELKRFKGGIRRIGAVLVHNGARLSPNVASIMITKFVKTHEVPRITMFSLRHSFATACVRAKVDVAVLSKWLGHVDVSTTLNKYVKPLLHDLHSESKLIDAAYKAV